MHLAGTEQPEDTATATATGKAFFDMLGVFAEFETNLRQKRQAEGIVGRTFAWLNRCCRLSKDWEKSIASAEA